MKLDMWAQGLTCISRQRDALNTCACVSRESVKQYSTGCARPSVISLLVLIFVLLYLLLYATERAERAAEEAAEAFSVTALLKLFKLLYCLVVFNIILGFL
jgi:hypothetical protein